MVIANLLEQLRQKGYLRDALVVVTSDHGESLGEHGLFGHANSVREELLKIPVVLLAYGYTPTRAIDSSILPLQIDIAPTILAELNIPQAATWQGLPLQAPAGHQLAHFEERAYSGLIDLREDERSWKYSVDRDTGSESAYDLRSDPRESRNLMAAIPPMLRSQWRRDVLYRSP